MYVGKRLMAWLKKWGGSTVLPMYVGKRLNADVNGALQISLAHVCGEAPFELKVGKPSG